MEDQRVLERWNLSDYVEVYDRNTERFIGHVVDISTDGMRVFGESPVQIETTSTFPIELKLSGSAEGSDMVQLYAAGVWCEEDPDPELVEFFNTGFTFLSLSAENYQKIEQLISDSSFRDWQRIPVY